MTRVVEASSEVLVMRNPKKETHAQFMARAEKLAEELYVEPAGDKQVDLSPSEETLQSIKDIKRELDYLRWFHTHIAQRGAEGMVKIQEEYLGVIPTGYVYKIEDPA